MVPETVSAGFLSRYIFFGIRSFFFILCTASAALLAAQDAETLPEVEVTVVAEDLSGPAASVTDVDLASTTSVYSTVDIDARRGEVSTLGDVLAREAGLQIKKAGTAGSFATVSLRGTASNQVAVYVDGIPLGSGRSGYIDLSDIPLDIIDTIEVFRGSAPARFTEGNLGGVINIRTHRRPGMGRVAVTAGAESFGTFNAGVNGFELFELVDLQYSASFDTSRGDYAFENNNGTSLNDDDDFTDTRINNDYTRSVFGIACRIYPDDDTVISLSETLTARERGIPGRENNQSAHARYASSTSLFNIGLERTTLAGGSLDLAFRIYWKTDADAFRDEDAEVGLGASDVTSRIDEIGISAVAEYRAGPWTAALTGLACTEGFAPRDELGASYFTFIPLPSSRDKNTLALDLNYAAPAWIVSATLRQAVVANDLNSDTFSNHVTDSLSTWQTGLKWFLTDTLTLKANLGTYGRFPTMGELFGDWGFFLGSPELEPETGINADLSLAWTPTAGNRTLFGLTGAEVTLFSMRITDYIQYLFNAQGVGRPENLGEAEITGAEFASHHAWELGFTFDHGLTLQRPVDRTDIDYNYGNILPGRAQLLYTAEFGYTVAAWRLFASLLVETGTYYDSVNLRPAPDKQPFGIGIEYRAGDRGRVSFRVDNIFDDRYEDYGGYPLPGRMFVVNGTMEF